MKLRRREWNAFHEEAHGSLLVSESKLFGEALALDGPAWDLFVQYAAALLGQEHVDAWIEWATAVGLEADLPEDIPEPPDEPGGLWERARQMAAEGEEYEMRCAGGYVVALLSYARTVRERVLWHSA